MGQGIQGGAGRYLAETEARVEADAGAHSWTNAEPNTLMEQVLERPNLMRAYQRVVSNKGAAGVDQMPVTALKGHLQQHWPTLRERLLAGDYYPQPVRRVSIPKPQGGERILGIPTVQDCLIQQALHQTLSPMLEPTFSDHSYGFRSGRSAHQAVKAMQRHINDGNRWEVDLDLAQFFDRVNHDVLMGLLARRITDRRILILIRRYLQAGMLEGGLVSPRREGTPQGGLIALALQRAPDRAGPGVGAPGAPVLPLRGRLQHLREQQKSRRAGHGQYYPVPGNAPALEGEHGEKRRRPPLAPELPGVQRELAQATGTVEGCTEEPEGF